MRCQPSFARIGLFIYVAIEGKWQWVENAELKGIRKGNQALSIAPLSKENRQASGRETVMVNSKATANGQKTSVFKLEKEGKAIIAN